MSAPNPYATPVRATRRIVLPEDEIVTDEIRKAMAGTRPWVMFLAILGFGSAAFALLSLPLWLMFPGFEGWARATIAFIYLGIALVYIVGSRHLLRYGGAIQQILDGGYGVHALEDALRHQRSFWRFVGIVSIASVALMFVMPMLLVPLLESAPGP